MNDSSGPDESTSTDSDSHIFSNIEKYLLEGKCFFETNSEFWDEPLESLAQINKKQKKGIVHNNKEEESMVLAGEEQEVTKSYADSIKEIEEKVSQIKIALTENSVFEHTHLLQNFESRKTKEESEGVWHFTEEDSLYLANIYAILDLWSIEVSILQRNHNTSAKENYAAIKQLITDIGKSLNRQQKADAAVTEKIIRLAKFIKWKFEYYENDESKLGQPSELSTYVAAVKFRSKHLQQESDGQLESTDKKRHDIRGIIPDFVDLNVLEKNIGEKQDGLPYLAERIYFAITFWKDYWDFCDEKKSLIDGACHLYYHSKKSDTEYADKIFEKNCTYFHNNYISYLLEEYKARIQEKFSKTGNDDAISDLEKEMDNALERNFEPSYFSFAKIAEYRALKAQTASFRSKIDFESEIRLAKEYKYKAERIYNKKGQYTYPFSTTLEFSKQGGIFSLSTFIDNDGRRYADIFISLEIGIRKAESIYEAAKLFDKKTKSAFEELQMRAEQEIGKGQKKTVEIISIFTAIAILASGEIQIFQKHNTALGAALFGIAFAVALVFFVYLIQITLNATNKNTEKNVGVKKNMIFTTLYALTVVFFIIVGCVGFLHVQTQFILLEKSNFENHLQKLLPEYALSEGNLYEKGVLSTEKEIGYELFSKGMAEKNDNLIKEKIRSAIRQELTNPFLKLDETSLSIDFEKQVVKFKLKTGT